MEYEFNFPMSPSTSWLAGEFTRLITQLDEMIPWPANWVGTEGFGDGS